MKERSSIDAQSVNGHFATRLEVPVILGLLALFALTIDDRFVEFMNPDGPSSFDGFAKWLDEWSTRVLLIACFSGTFAAFLFDRWRPSRVHAVTFVLGWAMTQTVVESLKRLVGRPRPLRPEALAESLRPLFENVDTRSFPSGHSATAAACAVLVMFMTKNIGVRAAVWLFAIAIGVGRSYIGAHYLSDVLGGAAFGWGAMILARHLATAADPWVERWDAPRRHLWATIAVFAVILAWLLKAPPQLFDAIGGERLREFARTEPMLRSLFEPFIGFGLHVATLPEMKTFATMAAGWIVVLGALIVLRRRRRAIIPLLLAGLLGMSNAWFAVAPTGLEGRLRARAGVPRPLLVADFHSHGGDPYDGHIDEEAALERFRSLGYELIIPTHHNRWSRARLLGDGGRKWKPIDLYGMEWSSGPARGTDLHFLVYNDRPEPADLGSITDASSMVAAAKAAGAIVHVAHHWRTRSGDAPRPDVESLVAMGVDGFETANRNQEFDRVLIDRVAKLRDAAIHGSRKLVLTANGDDHGRRAATYCFNVLPGIDRAGADVAREVLRALRDPEAARIAVTTERTIPPESGFDGVLLPPWTLVRYLRELSLLGRLSWIVWIVAAATISTRFRRRPE